MKLRDFRAQYPQYDGIGDAELAAAFYSKYYASEMPFEQFASLIELNGPPIAAGTENLDPRDYQALTPAVEGSAIQSMNNPPSGRPWADFVARQNRGEPMAESTPYAPESTAAAIDVGLKQGTSGALNVAEVIGRVGVFRYLDRELKAMDAIDKGETVNTSELPYAEAYGGLDKEQRDLLRQRTVDSLAANEGGLKAAVELFRKYQQETQNARGTIPEVEQLWKDPEARKRWDDWLRWNIAQGFGSTAPFLAAGVTAALLRSGLGGLATTAAGRAAAGRVAESALAATSGALGYGMGLGELGGELINEAIKDGVVDEKAIERLKQNVQEGGAGVLYGAAPHAAIELYMGLTYRLLKSFSGMPVREAMGELAKITTSKAALKYALKEGGLSTLGEGNEEILQQGLGDVLKLMRGSATLDEVFSKQNAWKYAEAWGAGAAGGLGLSGGPVATTAIRARVANKEYQDMADRSRRVIDAIESKANEAARAASPVEEAGITPVIGSETAPVTPVAGAETAGISVPGVMPSPVAAATSEELGARIGPVEAAGITPVVGEESPVTPAVAAATPELTRITEPIVGPIDRNLVATEVKRLFGHNDRFLTILTNPEDPAFVESGRLDIRQHSRDEGLTVGDRAYLFLDNIEPQFTPSGKQIMDRSQRAIWVAAHELEHVAQNKLKAAGTGLGKVVTSPQWSGYTKALRAMHQNANFQQIADMMQIERGQMSPLVASMEAAAEVGAAVTTGRFDELADRYRVTIDNAQTKELTGLWKRLALRARVFLSSIGVRKLSDADLIQIMHMQRKALSDTTPVEPTALASRPRDEYPKLKGEGKVLAELAANPEWRTRKVKGEEQIVGAKGMDEPAIRRAVGNMTRLINRGIESKDWYIDSAKAILEASGGDMVTAERLVQLLSISSSGTSVKGNFTDFVKALGQFSRGEPIKVSKPEVNDKIRDLLYFGRDWDGRKTSDFYRNIVDRMRGVVPDYPVIDRHQFELTFGKGTKSGGQRQYEFAQDRVREVAKQMGLASDQAQAAMWVGKKMEDEAAKMMDGRDNKPTSKFKGWTDEQIWAEAYRKAKTSYADEIKSRNFTMPAGTFEKIDEVFNRVEPNLRNVTGEAVPSRHTKIGDALLKLPVSKRKSWQGRALTAVFGKKSGQIDFGSFLSAFGIDPTKWRADYGTGGFESKIGPNVVLQLNTTSDVATRVAKAWQAIFHQDAVPFFRADPNLIDDATVPHGVWLRLDRDLSEVQEQRFYETLQAEAKTDFTRMGDREYAIVNFRGNDGKPFSGLDDQAFLDAVDRTLGSVQAKVEASHDFGAETFYEEQNVQDRSEQVSLLDAAAAGSPALRRRLRSWSAAFEKFAGSKNLQPLRSVPRSAEPAVRPGGQGATTAVGIHFGREPGLTSLSGSSFGTGIRGAEQERLSYADPRLRKRVYFYLQTGEGFDVKRREAGLGPHAYRAQLGNLYEHGVSDNVPKVPVYSNEQFKIVDQGETNNRWEAAVLDAGFDGYLIRNPDIAVVLNRDVPVEFLGTLGQQPPIQFSQPRRLFDRLEKISDRYPAVAEFEDAWRGGVANLGDARAGNLVFSAPNYRQYIAEVQRAVRDVMGDEFDVYRYMAADQAEEFDVGAGGDAVGVTLSPDRARSWGKLAAMDKVTRRAPGKRSAFKIRVTPEMVVMAGKAEEEELVIDSGSIGGRIQPLFSQARTEPSKSQGRADIISRISPELLNQIQVDAQVFIESENRYVMEKVSAKEALDAIDEDMKAYQALLDCVRG